MNRLPTDAELDELIDELSHGIYAIHEFKKMIAPFRIMFSSPNDPTPAEYVSAICATFEMEENLIKVPNRKTKYVFVRHCIFYFLYEHFAITKKVSQKQLSKVLCKDRTTMIHSHETAKELLEAKDVLFTEYFTKAEQSINFLIKQKQQNNE